MKLQTLTIIFIIIILPVVLVLSSYIDYEIQTIYKQNAYNRGVIQATHDAIFSFELNTKNDSYSNNAENKRSNIKAAVKTFENSLSSTCNLGLYNNTEIEEYIPAMLFGLYDGFYMYAPSENNGEYKHNLRSYVYYSEQIPNTDIVIRYTLDNYVAVSGTFKKTTDTSEKYQTMAGYLVAGKWEKDTQKYNGIKIDTETIHYNKLNDDMTGTYTQTNVDDSAQKYYEEASVFTDEFNEIIKEKLGESDPRYIKDDNDPEDENSAFVQHKREIMKEKIEGVLNSSITAFANKTNSSYRMPKLLVEEWKKIYTNISVIAFVQGMNLGFKKYNSYCVLNSTNNSEFVNPDLLYFISNDGYYHDITCENINGATNLVGYKIGDFEKIKYEANPDADTTNDKIHYYYKHDEYACYGCINGGGDKRQSKNIYDFIKDSTTSNLKKAYYTALARERQNTVKLLSDYNK